MDYLDRDVDEVLNGVLLQEKVLKFYDYSPLTKGQAGMEVDEKDDELWPLSVLLTPPSSPDNSSTFDTILDGKITPLRHHFVDADENLTQETSEILLKSPCTKDLKSMLIRDCMWNGESPKKPGNFEKLRTITKTPPLIDCSLRVMFVDPCEIWPFNISEQLKARKSASPVHSRDNNNDHNDEDVEVDVVTLEGSRNVEAKKNEIGRNLKIENEIKMEDKVSTCSEVGEDSSVKVNTDDEYSCKLRSGLKRRKPCNNDSDKENCSETKTRVLCGDESDPECDIVGRATHNVLERKRRNELKMRFQYLRDSIPDICGNDRTPKVSILQKAYRYILQLQEEERNLMEQIRIQKNRKEQLVKIILEMQNDNLPF